jgi:transcriptional regulator with XRE-family HTH domain
METIGDRVRRTREGKGIARGDLARAVGLSYTGLSDLESGKAKTTTKLHRLATELGVAVEWLETGKGSSAPRQAAPEQVSRSVRLDAEIVAATHVALAEMYEKNGRKYHMEDVARFVLVYEKLALRKAGVTEAELFGAGLSETVTPQGATSERVVGVPSKGTHKGVVARRVRHKA